MLNFDQEFLSNEVSNSLSVLYELCNNEAYGHLPNEYLN